MKLRSLAVCLLLTLNSCVVGYNKYPRAQLARPAPEKRFKNVCYTIVGTSLSGGYLSIRDTFKQSSPFETVEERPEVTNKGLFIKAQVETISPSIGAMVAGYVSYATLTLIPSWSTQDGALVKFTVYKDGQIVKTFDYEARRFIGVWLGFLPIAWANFFTANEGQVFTAMTKQFFEDAQSTFQ